MILGLGKNIAELRKKYGLTQAQLAKKIGVTAPAVSKWENGNGYPDITLLPVIARLFDTSVDKLLNYTPTLSDEERNNLSRECSSHFRNDSFSAAYEYAVGCINEFPNDASLAFEVCRLIDCYLPSADDEPLRRAVLHKQAAILEQLSMNKKYREDALMDLGFKYLQLEETERVEKLVSDLYHEIGRKPERLRIALCIYQRKYDEALKVAHKCLRDSVDGVLYALHDMAVISCQKERYKDALNAVETALIIKKTLSMNVRCIESYQFAAWIHLKLGKPEEAVDSLKHAVDCCKQILEGNLHGFGDSQITLATNDDYPVPDIDICNAFTLKEFEKSLSGEPAFLLLVDKLNMLKARMPGSDRHSEKWY